MDGEITGVIQMAAACTATHLLALGFVPQQMLGELKIRVGL
jgi:hypothetical protein